MCHLKFFSSESRHKQKMDSKNSFIIYLLIGSNFTVKGNIQDVTKVTGTITKQKHNNKQSQSSLIFVKI